ncbi:MAG: PfkB family carbohydrate kinase [Bacilli bacterium]
MIYALSLNPTIDYFATYEQLKTRDVSVLMSAEQSVGGIGVSVARYLKRLQHEQCIVGFVGGVTGNKIEQLLTSEELHHAFTQCRRESLVAMREKGDRWRAVDDLTLEVSVAEVDAFMEQFNSMTSDDLVVITGEVPSSLPQYFYAEIIGRLRRANAHVAIDATKATILKAIPYEPFAVSVTVPLLEELFKKEIPTFEEAIHYGKLLQAQGVKHVLLRYYDEGALLIMNDEVYFSPSPPFALDNKLRAEDAFLAGFLAATWHGGHPVSGLELAVALSAAVGLTEGKCSYHDVLVFCRNVIIYKIDEQNEQHLYRTQGKDVAN